VTATACTAVGQYQTYPGGKDPVIEDVALAEHWDGKTWTTVPVESPPAATAAGLSAVSCSGSTCTAVGGYTDGAGTQEPLAESSTGSSFTTEAIGPPARALGGVLAGISCTGALTCTAVGLSTGSSDTSSQALAETE
jgi:hypothetical protein